jgi:23S rRNA pseudouridine2605 synthase
MADNKDEDRERIAKVMARAGVASRRDAEAMIAEGRVSVNGGTVRTPAVLVGLRDRIAVDGVQIGPKERTRLWLYHKPAGLVTTAHDPEGRPTVFDNLPGALPRVVSIGRLDINTEGLLLLTNDGGLARVLAHPETGWLRRYRVRAFGEVTADELKPLIHGITLDGMHYGPIEAAIEREQGDNVWLTLGLREGKNREVKRVLEHLGLKVNRLIRVSFGPFQLGDLAEGTVEEVRTRVLKDQLGSELASRAGVDFDPPAAGQDGRSPRDSHLRPRFARDDRKASASPQARNERPRAPSLSWRDTEADAMRPRGAKRPRRGEDPRAARSASAERAHQRAGRVSDPKGRGVLVERIVGAPKEEARARPKRHERFKGTDPSSSGEGAPDARRPGWARQRSGDARATGRAPRSADQQSGEQRPFHRTRRDERQRERGGEHRRDGKPWEKRGPQSERPWREKQPWKPKGPKRDGEQRSFGKGRGDEVRTDRGGDRPRDGGKPWRKPRERSEHAQPEKRPWGSKGPRRDGEQRPFRKEHRDSASHDRGGDRPRGGKPWQKPRGDRPRSDQPRSDRPRPDGPRRGPDRPRGPRRPEGPRR